jgi:hypothetical protein
MASLLTDAQKAKFTRGLDDLFDTFKQEITVHKEAQIQLIDINQPRMFGYNERVDLSNLTFQPISATFYALVNYQRDQKQDRLKGVNNFITKGEVSIKVKADAKNYIDNNGNTLNITINNTLYEVISSESVRRFISPDYYTYYLERVR